MTCYRCFQEYKGLASCPHCGFNPESQEGKYPHALRPGTIVGGQYIVGHVLGQGGFGITYVAQDYNTKDLVAVKEFMPSEHAGRLPGSSSIQIYSRELRELFDHGKEQFLAEAKTLAGFIGNEHIVSIYSYFEENNTAYFTMEYVDGQSLDKYISNFGGKLSFSEAAKLLSPIMNALENVHSKGIIHRDISPDNILITNDGIAKLIDFGAARYSTGEKSKSLDVILKHGFAPKEQYLRRGRQGAFTDVYALAATFYYAITGKVPPEAIARMEEDELLAPSVLGVKMPGNAEDVLLKALEVSAQDRYQTMGEFSKALSDETFANKKAYHTTPIKAQKTPENMADNTYYSEIKREFGAPSNAKTYNPTPKKSGWIKRLAIATTAILLIYGFGHALADVSQSSQGKELKTPITATIQPTATVKSDSTISQLIGSWGSDPIYLRHGNSTYAYELFSPVKNCTELTLNMAVLEYTGYPFDEWYLYARDLDGNWNHIAMFTLEETIALNETLKFPFKFDTPESFDALAIEHVADGYWYNITWDITYTNVKTK